MTTISTLPPYPDPVLDTPEDFSQKALDWSIALPGVTAEINTVAGEVITNAATATTAAGTATTQAGTATTQAGNANTARIAAEAAAASAVNAPGTQGTSTTSLTIGAGTQTFTTQIGKAWALGQPVVIARTSAPGTTRMSGVVIAYNTGTGSMSVLVDALTGTGTFTDWTISLGTDRSLAGQVTAVAMAANNIDCSLGTYFYKTISANTTLTVSNVPPSGTRYACIVEITHTSGVITPPAGHYWAGGIAPTLNTGKVHELYMVTRNGGTTWRISARPNFAG